jgi:hypothetical protein
MRVHRLYHSDKKWVTVGVLTLAVLLFAHCAGSGSKSSSSVNACSLTTSTLSSTGIQVYPGPTGSSTYLSSLYTVEVYDGTTWQPSYTYAFNRTSKTAWHQNANPSVNFSTFATNRAVNVRITNTAGSLTSVSISPLNLGITATITGNQAAFTLNQTNKVWITLNGDDSNPLFVFADGPKPTVPTSCSNFVYYGPGVTTINQYQASSGQTIYLDGGAVVRGNINVAGTKNVQIVGPGILSGDLWTGETIQALGSFSQQVKYAMISGDYNGSDNATVSGITILDSPFYNFWGGASNVSGIKELSPWFYSTDGFESVNHVDQVFAFIGDNVFFPGQEGIDNDTVTVTNSFAGTTNNAVFCGGFWGNANSSSFASSATMNNIDIKTYTSGTYGTHTPAVFQIWVDNNISTSGYANQTYSNIRIEGNLNSDLAELVNMPYPAAWGGTTYTPALGNSYNISFQNITLSGTQSTLSSIQGYDSTDGFHNVTWQSLSINGTAVTNANSSTYFNTNAYVWGLNFQ